MLEATDHPHRVALVGSGVPVKPGEPAPRLSRFRIVFVTGAARVLDAKTSKQQRLLWSPRDVPRMTRRR